MASLAPGGSITLSKGIKTDRKVRCSQSPLTEVTVMSLAFVFIIARKLNF